MIRPNTVPSSNAGAPDQDPAFQTSDSSTLFQAANGMAGGMGLNQQLLAGNFFQPGNAQGGMMPIFQQQQEMTMPMGMGGNFQGQFAMAPHMNGFVAAPQQMFGNLQGPSFIQQGGGIQGIQLTIPSANLPSFNTLNANMFQGQQMQCQNPQQMQPMQLMPMSQNTSTQVGDSPEIQNALATIAAARAPLPPITSERRRINLDGSHPPVVVYMECDEESLSDYQCLLRKQVELFEATSDDVQWNAQGRNKAIVLGQVGIRCRYCARLPTWSRSRGAVYYSATLDGLYQAAQNMAKNHLCRHCRLIPEDVRKKLTGLRECKRRAAGGKKYWAEGARVLGVYPCKDGLRFKSSATGRKRGGEPGPEKVAVVAGGES